MLKIPINRDIETYSEGIIFGMSFKEIKNLVKIIVLSSLLIVLLSRVVPLIAAVYISSPIIGLMAISGRKTGNISFKEVMKYWGTYSELKKGIEFNSNENPNEYRGEINERRIPDKDEN